MSETPKVQPNPNGEPSPEKRDNLFTKAARKLGEVAVSTWRVVTGRDSGERADTSSTIAPEAPVESGDTSPIAMSEEQLEGLRNTPEYPVYPKSSLPKFVTKPDGRQYPAEIEPPKPTPLDILINKRKDEARAAKYSSSVNPDVYTRVKGENVIDKDMFSTTIPNVDKPKKDDNPEGLTLYEQAMRDKYLGLGDEHDDAEKTEMSMKLLLTLKSLGRGLLRLVSLLNHTSLGKRNDKKRWKLLRNN